MPPVDQLESLALTLFEFEAIRFGSFALHSGRTSPIYIDLRLLASYPAVLRQAAAAYRLRLDHLSFDLLAATPLAGLPIGTAIALDMNLPLIYPRQSAKSYGTGKQIEGKWAAGQTAVVIDDLITSGDSLLGGIDSLEAAGLSVNEAVVLIDREQGGREMLAAQGYTLHSIMTISKMLAILAAKNKITTQKQAEVLSSLKS